MGRPRKTLNTEQIAEIERLSGLGLNEAKIAYVMGMHPDTFRARKREHDRVLRAIENGKAKAENEIGRTLFDKARAGDLGAIVWWEKTRADRRETVKQEITGADGAPLVFTLDLGTSLHDDDSAT
jgi:hypothetical protein